MVKPIKGLENWGFDSHCSAPHGYLYELDKSVRYKNEPSACISSKPSIAEEKEDFAQITQKFRARNYLGKRLRFSGMLKTDGKSRAVLYSTVNGNNGLLSFDGMQGKDITSSEWQPASIVFDVPPESKSIAIGAHINGLGKIWVSGLTLEEVGKEVPVTSNSQGDKRPYEPYLRPKPSNTSFEDVNVDDKKVIQNWSVHIKGDYNAYVDRAELREGKPSARIDSTKTEPAGFCTVDQNVNALSYKCKRVKFSAYLKTKGIKDWAAVWMRVDGPETILGFDNMENRPVKGTVEWTKYSIVLDVPEQAKKIKYGFMQSGEGTLWCTDTSLEIVGKDVPVTADPIVEESPIPEPDFKPAPKLKFEDK